MMTRKSKTEDLFVRFTKLCIQGCAKVGWDSLMKPDRAQSPSIYTHMVNKHNTKRQELICTYGSGESAFITAASVGVQEGVAVGSRNRTVRDHISNHKQEPGKDCT